MSKPTPLPSWSDPDAVPRTRVERNRLEECLPVRSRTSPVTASTLCHSLKTVYAANVLLQCVCENKSVSLLGLCWSQLFSATSVLTEKHNKNCYGFGSLTNVHEYVKSAVPWFSQSSHCHWHCSLFYPWSCAGQWLTSDSVEVLALMPYTLTAGGSGTGMWFSVSTKFLLSRVQDGHLT